ncbi:Uncharacterised protein r2_g3535 [Pycnogonum litorale]
MSAASGVQGIIREQVPAAVYTHCNSHLLNLTIVASCKNEFIRNMMSSINEIYLFFNNSNKRQSFLTKVMSRSNDSKKLQGLCKTRWANDTIRVATAQIFFQPR